MTSNRCYRCGKSDNRPVYPDPCCSAPDCPDLTTHVHYECASESVKREIEEWDTYAD